MKEINRRKFLVRSYKEIVKYSRMLNSEAEEQEHSEIVMPILYFHEVPSQTWFSNYVLNLITRGYYPTNLSDLKEYFETGETNWEGQPFILTLDDGLKSQIDNAVPFLKQYMIPAVFAVIPTYQDGVHEYMTEDEIKDLSDFGFEIASHTFTHPFLSKLRLRDEEKWRRDIVDSKYYLENLIGKQVNSFVYPNGDADKQTLLLVSETYDIALSTKPGNIQKSNEINFLRRTRVN